MNLNKLNSVKCSVFHTLMENVFLFFIFSCAIRLAGSQFPNQGLNLEGPLAFRVLSPNHWTTSGTSTIQFFSSLEIVNLFLQAEVYDKPNYHYKVALWIEQGSPTSGPWTGTSYQIISTIRLEIKCTINVMCLNHLKIILPKVLGKTIFHETGPW